MNYNFTAQPSITSQLITCTVRRRTRQLYRHNRERERRPGGVPRLCRGLAEQLVSDEDLNMKLYTSRCPRFGESEGAVYPLAVGPTVHPTGQSIARETVSETERTSHTTYDELTYM